MIWKEFSGKKISHAMLHTLLEKGHTQLLTFKAPEGEYKARISLADRISGKLEIDRE
ncbi:hypothetical protein D1872_339830 [compost metagenome]